MAPLKLALPWLFLFVGLWASILIINGAAPAACDQLSDAFRHGKHTEVSGDDLGFVSRCAVTDRSTGTKVEKTEINWSGIIASVAGCIGAWLMGAAIVGLVDRRRGLTFALASLLVAAGALVVFFV
jgi:hypothetical protein